MESNQVKRSAHNRGVYKTNIPVGYKSGALTVLEELPGGIVKCICECGVVKEYKRWHIIGGKNSRSCGCKRFKYWSGINKDDIDVKSYKRIQRIHSLMIARCCDNKIGSYKDYGGRGISVCEEWKVNFLSFYNWSLSNGYGSNLQIDRKDNDGNYSPENCRWVTPLVNGRNTRHNVIIEYNGQRRPISEWGEILGVPSRLIRQRMARRWTFEEAITIPLKNDGGEFAWIRHIRSGQRKFPKKQIKNKSCKVKKQ